MWVMTSEYDDYNQFGEYFITAWINKPSLETLTKFLETHELRSWYQHKSYEDFADHLLNGGGRINDEDKWYYLKEINEGENYA